MIASHLRVHEGRRKRTGYQTEQSIVQDSFSTFTPPPPPSNSTPRSLLDMEHKPALRADLTPNLGHILDEVMRATVLDLVARVARAERDDSRAARDARADARGRVLEDDASLGVVAQAGRGEEEWVWGGLAGLETLVVCGDRHGRGRDADAGHGAVG